ncbi:MAG TPA: helix-turn-helix transcriptional regulator [Gemmatimonadaceae bacterium]
MRITYAERAPGVGLADAVRCYWTIRGEPDDAEPDLANRVLPDNCIDVIFDLARDSGIVVGPMLTAEVFAVRGHSDMIGVRFCPGAATEFLDLKASELATAHLVASDVWPDAPALADRLRAAPDQARGGVLDAYLRGRRRERKDAVLARAVAASIGRARGMLTVQGLTATFAVNERRLQRAFDAAVGIGPKQVMRVARFRSAAAMLSAAPQEPLARIALACGYADQAHFTREFSELAGLTPTAWRIERRLVGFVQD